MKNIIKNFIYALAFVALFGISTPLALAAAPSVITDIPSATTTSITLNGVFIANGAQTTTRFEYATNQSTILAGNGNVGCQVLQPVVPGSGSFSCTLNVPTITANTLYYFRAVATNVDGTAYGSIFPIQTMFTPPVPASIVTAPSVITAIPATTTTSITLNGVFIANGGQTTTRFEYATNQTTILAGNGLAICQVLQPISQISGDFSCTLNVPTITASNIYHFRAAATNLYGTSYGAVFSVAINSVSPTPTPTPTVSTTPTLTSISPTSKNRGQTFTMTLNGTNFTSTATVNFSSSSGITINSVNFVDSGELTASISIASSASTGTRQISVITVNGTSNTRNFNVTNPSSGGGGGGGGSTPDACPLIPGFQISTTSCPINPSTVSNQFVVTTVLATSKTSTTARLNGIAVNMNSATTGYFEYGTSVSLGRTTSAQNLGSSGQISFADTITGLTPNTIYYFRAVGSNTSNVIRGDIRVFKTTKLSVIPSPVVNTPPASPTISTEQGEILEITNDNDEVTRGDKIKYLVIFRNNSTENFENTKIVVQLPNEIDFISSNFGKVDSDNTVTFDADMLIPNQVGSMTITGQVNGKAEEGAILVTTVAMTYNIEDSTTEQDEIAYVTNHVIAGNELAAASVFGDGFLPKTLIGWLILLLIVMAVIVFGKRLIMGSGFSRQRNNEPTHL